jgi:hypothetical protein
MQMLQDGAKKCGEPRSAASGRRLHERALRDLTTAKLPCLEAVSLGAAVLP